MGVPTRRRPNLQGDYGEPVLTIEELYAEKCFTPSDISPLMPVLRHYADECEVVVEFGIRHGFSSTAFLASKCKQLISYDLNMPEAMLPPETAAKWGIIQVDTSRLETGDIPVCDMLFIDTLHTQAQVREELRQHICVKKYIAFHDTVTFGLQDEGYAGRDQRSQPGYGVMGAVMEFLVDHPEWRVNYWTPKSNGLLILEKANDERE